MGKPYFFSCCPSYFLCYNKNGTIFQGFSFFHSSFHMSARRRFWVKIIAIFALVLAFAGTSVHAQYPGFDDPGARTAGGATGSGIVPVAPLVDGGTIPTGATAQVVVRFRNDGAQPVETGAINLYPSSTVSATISLNQCASEPLATGAECAIALSVKGLQPGPWRVEMLMRHSGRNKLVTATLSGQVEATGEASDKLASDIEAIPDEVDFETLNDSQTMVRPVILRNITSMPIKISDIYIDTTQQAGFNLKTDCETLQAGQACIATVTWSPLMRGPSTGILVVRHDGPTALASVGLKGEYEPDEVEEAQIFPEAVPGKGLLVASQTEVEFGDDVVSASTITVSLVNAGDAPLTISDVRVAGQDNGLGFKGDGCVAGLTLQPIEACPLTISWSPTRVGTLLDDIQITHDGARGVLILPVRGGSGQVVSQDQQAILLSEVPPTILDDTDVMDNGERPDPAPPSAYASSTVQNPASVLDGLKITSFSSTRAIVNGPGGSRILFDGEEVMLGGIPWSVTIQKNGIEFGHAGQRVLLLFDRSLSSINRVSTKSDSGTGSSGSGSSSSSSSSTDDADDS
jgi:hypothetical protein